MSALYRSLWNDRLEALCDEYRAWCVDQRLPHVWTLTNNYAAG